MTDLTETTTDTLFTWSDTSGRMAVKRAAQLVQAFNERQPDQFPVGSVLRVSQAGKGKLERLVAQPDTVRLQLVLNPVVRAQAILAGAKQTPGGGLLFDVKSSFFNADLFVDFWSRQHPLGVYAPEIGVPVANYAVMPDGVRDLSMANMRQLRWFMRTHLDKGQSIVKRLADVASRTNMEPWIAQPWGRVWCPHAYAGLMCGIQGVGGTQLTVQAVGITQTGLAPQEESAVPWGALLDTLGPAPIEVSVHQAAAILQTYRHPELELVQSRPGLVETVVEVAQIHTVLRRGFASCPMWSLKRKGTTLGQVRYVNAEVAEETVSLEEFARRVLPTLFDQILVDPDNLLDLVSMAVAVPADNPKLFGYQNDFVGLANATSVGLVNASEVGLGKTPMWAAAAQLAAGKITGYRALVVCQADKRVDWINEIGAFFPEATVVTAYSKSQVNAAVEQMTSADRSPVVMVCSYENARNSIAALEPLQLHDLVVDEADVLWSSGTGRTKALWQLRERAVRAMALSGTPLDKNMLQLARLVAFVRNEPDLAGPLAASMTRAMNSGGNLQDIMGHLGPVMFRRSKNEVASDRSSEAPSLPSTGFEVVPVVPGTAEAALAHAARSNLLDLYTEMMALIELLGEQADQQRRDDLMQARGRVLSGITLARLACSAPECLMESDAFGAALLRGAGLVQAAMAEGNTKLRLVTEGLQQVVAQGGAALVFTDFSQVARVWGREMSANTKMRIAVLTGQVAPRRREMFHKAFNEGEIDVLIQSAVGAKGLNLQTRTTHIVHADLPWVPSALLQRHGRADRIGAGTRDISVWMPFLSGTVEERVLATVAARVGAVSMLDAARHSIVGTERATMISSMIGAADMTQGAATLSMVEMCGQVLAA